MTPPPCLPAPAPSAIRDTNLDAVRGLAILGLIFSNMPSLASADADREWMGKPEGREGWVFFADFAIEWLIVGNASPC